jgi:hypothetical protein
MQPGFLKWVLWSGMVAVAGMPAWAQWPGDGYYSSGRNGRGSWSVRDDRGMGIGLVQRVVHNLEMAESRSFVHRHERSHFRDARKHLLKFNENWRRGRFDQGRLDRAMDDMRHLVRADQVHPQVRQVIARDLRDLQRFRSGGGYGAGYGYRR